jgi:hypothetical protein
MSKSKYKERQMDRTKQVTKTFYNVPMHIMNDVRIVKEVKLTLYQTGEIAISFEEYNRILDEIHREWMKKRRKG